MGNTNQAAVFPHFTQQDGQIINIQPIRLLAQTTLRNILGTKHLHEILSERDSISSSMQVQKIESSQKVEVKAKRYFQFVKGGHYNVT